MGTAPTQDTGSSEVVCPSCHFIFPIGTNMNIPVPGEKQMVNKDQAMKMLLPIHFGITPTRLMESMVAARQKPLDELYDYYVGEHNKSSAAGTASYVWGAGSAQTARVIMVGEGPGPEENRFGIPFIGPAGECLSAVIGAANLSRADDILLLNAVNCMPPGVNGKSFGKPSTKDLWENRPRVLSVIKAMADRPVGLTAVVCLGKFSFVQLCMPDRLKAAYEAGKEVSMDTIRISPERGWTNTLDFDDGTSIPVLVEFHPSYIMRKSNTLSSPLNDPEISGYLASFKSLKEKIDASNS